jgi:predicted DNA-binding mobile mystery protein A
MRNEKNLQISLLDEQLVKFHQLTLDTPPQNGWIHVIRKTLNMTLAQLANKLNMTKQGVQKTEESEAKGSISLKSLREIGDAMELKLVYGFVPKDGSLENLISKKAYSLAEKIVLRTNQNMKLEGQGIGEEHVKESIKDLAEELKREMKKSLWD